MQNLKISIVLFLAMVLLAIGVNAFAYDATGNFSQAQPELVAGWLLKGGSVKGGPYPSVTDCGKPAPKTDGTYDCVAKGQTANPSYWVVTNYDSTKKELATSTEAPLSITVQPPTSLKMVIVVTTTSKVSFSGKIISSTTIDRKNVASDVAIVEGSRTTRNARNEWITTTTIVM
jgi:hypothetical protein